MVGARRYQARIYVWSVDIPREKRRRLCEQETTDEHLMMNFVSFTLKVNYRLPQLQRFGTILREAPVWVRFIDNRIERLYTHGDGATRFPQEVVNALLRRMRHIEAARDERDLRTPLSVHYEHLKGQYIGQDSMRLNRQWRLILSVEEDTEGKYVVIHEITNHYGD